jgi:beta-glucosidase
MIRAVAAANPRTVVVLMAGASVTMEGWRDEVPAILLAWYPGMAGGSALADVLLGEREPGGRLPCVIPRDEADLPPFDKNATTATYDRWFGQRLLDRNGVSAAYPLGFGLSYTTFAIRAAEVKRADGDRLEVRATVANTGERSGGHVVQVYATRPTRPADQDEPRERFLVGFARVELAPAERVDVLIDVPLRRLARWTGPGRWEVPVGEYAVDVGASADDPACTSVRLEL